MRDRAAQCVRRALRHGLPGVPPVVAVILDEGPEIAALHLVRLERKSYSGGIEMDVDIGERGQQQASGTVHVLRLHGAVA